MRLGYFGGSFDPPHRAHLAVARAAATQFALDRVLLAPTGRQPLKPQGSTAGYADRLAMVRLLIDREPRLAASEVDGPRADGQHNYTVDALRTLRAGLSAEDELFAIVGADSLEHFAHWREPDRLLRLAEWIVVSRPGLDSRELVERVIAPDRRTGVHLLDGVHDPVSATQVRGRLEAGVPCDDLVPAAVLDYIRTHRLYAEASPKACDRMTLNGKGSNRE